LIFPSGLWDGAAPLDDTEVYVATKCETEVCSPWWYLALALNSRGAVGLLFVNSFTILGQGPVYSWLQFFGVNQRIPIRA